MTGYTGMKTASRRTVLDGPTLIFVHMGKTGGTTFKSILRRVYGQDRMFETTSGDVPGSIRRLSEEPEAIRAGYRVITGHIPFGLETLVPRESATVTLLRDPAERLVSNYFFIRRHPEHQRHREFLESDVTIEEFLSGQPDNPMTRRLLSKDPFNPRLLGSGEELTRDHLELAISNLRSCCDIVGLTERFDEFVALVSAQFGWPWVIYSDSNVTQDRPAVTNLSDAAQDLLQEKTALDKEFYNAAKTIFERQWRAATIHDRAYAKWLGLSSRVVTPLRRYLRP